MLSARYVVVHETPYSYQWSVGLSRQLVRLSPRDLSYQTCSEHQLVIHPTPEILSVGEDAFGNHITSICIDKDHDTLAVKATSRVEVSARTYPEDSDTPRWEDVRQRLTYRAGHPLSPEELDATRFLFESSRVRNKRELSAWAASSFPKGAPLLAAARDLMQRIHRDFAFDPKATTVSTTVMEVFASRRGVCQDFAHLMVSCLRSMGLPARYVSGYLLTRPPPGKPRLIGADASHAWVSVYCPDYGWVDLDPTNAVLAGREHVTLALGRDYDDVTPLRGVLLGGGEHKVDIAVTVAPEADWELLSRA